MKFEDLTQEQRDKIKGCNNPEEILALAKEEGYELSEGELEQISGGWGGPTCPQCGSSDIRTRGEGGFAETYCGACGYFW